MQIKRVLNNNAVISENHSGVEVLLMGSGIAWNKKRGQDVDISKVEQTFLLKNPDTLNKFKEVVIDAPMDEVLIAERIINYAKIKLGRKLNEIIYVNLTDHLHGAIERYRSGIKLTNPLKWDIARLYPDEYDVGMKAVELVKRKLGIDFLDDEAAFIALSFLDVESTGGNEQNNAYQMTQIVTEVEKIVKDFFHTEFDEQSLNYFRFITHLKFFAQRILTDTHYPDDDTDRELMESLSRRYPKALTCAQQVHDFIQRKYRFTISDQEVMYLTVHIARLVKNL
ncbi:putative transcription antiterminator LicT [Limosilactobacillus coleohominis 101-4-CHN]|uniref:Putative transcription antiterminator LicT n=1 Tax=Limosilactobacillus coleohominis 101-4-CHN TaxID=575594 RepID=C7XXG9_9LACO|nr:PRD domain-containing protein [Limosilactobacillus coleohominis]EEU29720.1 putative transcription antiterminator LicT [Limosilactobacillus coleohominis 101-4-CHN]